MSKDIKSPFNCAVFFFFFFFEKPVFFLMEINFRLENVVNLIFSWAAYLKWFGSNVRRKLESN